MIIEPIEFDLSYFRPMTSVLTPIRVDGSDDAIFVISELSVNDLATFLVGYYKGLKPSYIQLDISITLIAGNTLEDGAYSKEPKWALPADYRDPIIINGLRYEIISVYQDRDRDLMYPTIRLNMIRRPEKDARPEETRDNSLTSGRTSGSENKQIGPGSQ